MRWKKPVAFRRQGDVVMNARGERRRHRDDDMRGAIIALVAADRDALIVLPDRAYGGVEHDRRLQAFGETPRDRMRAAFEFRFLRAVLDADQLLDAVARPQIFEKEEIGHLRGFGAEDGARDDAREGPRAARANIALDPRLERLAVPVFRLRRGPRRLGRQRHHLAVPALHHAVEFEKREQRQFRNVALVGASRALIPEHLLALVILRISLDAELCGLREQQLLRRADPLTAAIDDLARDLAGLHPSADAVARLEHDDGSSLRLEFGRRLEPGETRADDDDIRSAFHDNPPLPRRPSGV